MGQCFLILFSLLTQVLVYAGGIFLLPVGFLLILRNGKSCKPQNKPLKIPPRLGLIYFPQNSGLKFGILMKHSSLHE